MMTYLALTRTDRIRAAVALAGPTDLVPGLEDRSAMHFVDHFPRTAPILIVHGTADWRVSPTDSLSLARLLLDRRIPFRLVLLEGGDHVLNEYELDVQIMIRDWLTRYLAPGACLPDMQPRGR